MVTKEIITKTFDKVIEVKHSDFLYNIEGTLREITDSKEEYNTLKDDIWQFWKETKNLAHEQLIMKGVNGTFFKNPNGDEGSVAKTEEMSNFIKESILNNGEKILYTMHNHPNGCCLASLEDTVNISAEYEKYKIMISTDGVCIFKLTDNKVLDPDNIVKSYNMMDKKLMRDFYKEYQDEVLELEEIYPDWYKSGTMDYVNYNKDYEGFFEESIQKHTDEYVELLNEKLHMKSRNVPLDVYHIPRSPRVK